jgi:phenylalanyl-tRNA synthetase alpha chain
MEAHKLAESLQEAEALVLKALKPSHGKKMDGLVKELKLAPEAIARASLWLQNKQLVSVTEHKHFSVILDELGRTYAIKGLPERKFLQAINKRPMFTDEIAKEANLDKQETLFSLGFWKKKNAITLENGKIYITDAGKEYLNKKTLEEQFIKNLNFAGEIKVEDLAAEDAIAFEELQKRGLAGKAEKKIRELTITPLGVKVSESITAVSRIGQLTPDVLKTGSWKTSAFRRFDITAPVPKLWPGKKQQYKAFLDEVREELVALGFEEMSGPIVESSFWNNDALYMPQDHPARGIHDLYFVNEPKYDNLKKYDKFVKAVARVHQNGGATGSTGWQYDYNEKEASRLVLRSQGTALSARMLADPNVKIPGAYFAVARIYRPDKIDITHLTEFNQCEGIVLGDKVNFRQLLGLLTEFTKKFAGTDKVRFVPCYFPFTEPSVEGQAWHPQLKRWIEVAPAGILRPEVTQPFGIKVPVLAWGIGIDRLFMIRNGISDIRELFSQDIEYLREAKL